MAFERLWHKHYPPGMPVELSFESLTMPQILTRTAERFPDHPALIFMGTVITYRELDKLVNRFARALEQLGIREGDKIAVILPNVPQIVIAVYAAFRIGAVNVMNNPLYTEKELTYQLNDSDSIVLITLDSLYPLAAKLKENTGAKKIILCSLADYLPDPLKPMFPPAEVPDQPDVFHFMDLLAGQPDTPVAEKAGLNDLSTLIYTGGTTGVSKGVMLSHRNISFNAQQLRTWLGAYPDGEQRTLAIFPFFHSAGFTGLMNISIYAGWTDILVPRPEPDRIIDLIEKFKPNCLPGVSTIFVALINNERFRNMDLSFLNLYMTGAAPMSPETIKGLKEIRDVPMINVYGLSEISPMGTAYPVGGLEKRGTVGIPLPSTDLKIVDLGTATEEMKIGEPGEICFKGPQVMLSYYKKPDETAKVLKDGWLQTGDIGILDDDGFLTIVDRKKDMIIASGFNIYPQ
ncbi:MAG TPA: AMP-binding protein, partial [Thermodesulfobacteriota bacterium]|nr:AMP-binding protein [Thermodesulfobacteriota bacterium]